MTAQALARHRAALLGRRRCPSCAELLPVRALLHDAPCPTCGQTVADVGIDASVAAAPLQRGLWGRLLVLTALVAVGNLVLGTIPLLAAGVMIVATAWLKLGLIDPVTRGFSPARRIVSRLTAKLGLVAVLVGFVLLVEAAVLLGPFAAPAKALVGAAEPLLAGVLVAAYLRWQLARELADRPLLWIEWVLVVAVGGALVAATAVVVGGLVALASVFEALMSDLSVFLGVS